VNPPLPAVIFSGLPDPEGHLRLARLETKITELAAHINAATFQLLKLICEYDEQDGMWVFKGKFTAETLPPLWRGEQLDQDLAQLGMQSLE